MSDTDSALSLSLSLACALICPSGSWFNLLMTTTQIVVIVVILGAGFSKGNTKNLTPFLPFG